MGLAQEISTKLKSLGNKQDAQNLQRFFKTGKGEYGEGDIFIGVRVPVIRRIAKQYRTAPLCVAMELLASVIHEQRLLALLLLVEHFRKAEPQTQKEIYQHYLANTQYINNWDLVDLSAEKIIGAYLYQRKRQVLTQLAKSKNLWERRIAIMATFHFIKHDDFSDTLRLAKLLLKDKEDLIHKATGWMLREIGNRNRAVEEDFLQQHYQDMPRTMLRYAIEKFPAAKRQQYLQGLI